MTGAIFVGIDPGQKGGIAALTAAGEVIGTWPMPLAGKDVHAAGFADLLRSLRCAERNHDIGRVVLEKVHAMPREGVSSAFRFGTGWGIIRGVCATLCVPVFLAPPRVWKKRVLLGLTHDKSGAVQFCTSRWPTADLVLPGCRVPHDGIADALCLADYGRCLEQR